MGTWAARGSIIKCTNKTDIVRYVSISNCSEYIMIPVNTYDLTYMNVYVSEVPVGSILTKKKVSRND